MFHFSVDSEEHAEGEERDLLQGAFLCGHDIFIGIKGLLNTSWHTGPTKYNIYFSKKDTVPHSLALVCVFFFISSLPYLNYVVSYVTFLQCRSLTTGLSLLSESIFFFVDSRQILSGE